MRVARVERPEHPGGAATEGMIDHGSDGLGDGPISALRFIVTVMIETAPGIKYKTIFGTASGYVGLQETYRAWVLRRGATPMFASMMLAISCSPMTT